MTLIQVETQARQQNKTEEEMARLLVMHQNSAINSFLFDEAGNLLLSNPSAQNYYKGELWACRSKHNIGGETQLTKYRAVALMYAGHRSMTGA